MTRISVNPTPRRLRAAFARLLSDFAREKGLAPILARDIGGKVRLSARAAADGKTRKNAAREASAPDLLWMDRGRAVWKFHILPGPRALKKLSPTPTASEKIILCADSSGNLGAISPTALLDFLEKKEETRETIDSLARAFLPLPTQARDFHFKGTVTKNHQYITDHYSLRIRGDTAPAGPAPGQFLQLLCDPAPHAESPEYKALSHGEGRMPKLRGVELLSNRPFLRRPFSIASYGPPAPRDDVKDARLLGAKWLDLISWLTPEFEIIYRRVPGGPGTGALAAYNKGDEIDVVGPLGNGFNLTPLPEVALLVGGGIGATPMLFLAQELVRRGVEVILFVGAVDKSRIPFRLHGAPRHRIPRFDRLSAKTIICTDDGSAGGRYLVTEPLEKYLEERSGPGAKIFACGPRPMLAALEGIAIRYGAPCEVLLEERMACGFGACISCVCGFKETGREARFTRVCTEGPAFDVEKVMWHA